MTERGTSPGCVFCGRPVEPRQEAVGRGSSTAHAECADRALADDAHWDRIADQFGDRDAPSAEEQPDKRASTTAGRSGCLSVAAIGLLLAARVAAPLATLLRRPFS